MSTLEQTVSIEKRRQSHTYFISMTTVLLIVFTVIAVETYQRHKGRHAHMA